MASKENIQFESGWKENNSGQQRTVRVLGLDTDDEETCKFYFKNTKRSGGGEVEGGEIKWDADESCFLITFTDDEVVQRVLERNHTLKGKEITVELWSTPSSSQFSSNIILSGVPEGTSEDLLQNFLESLTDVNVSSISLNHLSDKAVVTLAEPVEIAMLKHVCSKNNLSDNVKLSVQSAPVSDTILVQNIKPETNDVCVKFFFTNKKRNNGGPVKMVKRLSETSALICFQDPKDAEAVVKKDKHVLDDNILQVTLHFSEIEESKANQADSPGRQNFTQHQHHMEQQSQTLSPTSSCGIIHQKFPSQGANTTISLPHNDDDYTGKHEDMDWNDSNLETQMYSERGGKHYYHSDSQDTVHHSYKDCVGSDLLFANQSKSCQDLPFKENTRESQTQYHSRNRGANSTYSKQGGYDPQSVDNLYEEGNARPHNNAHRGFASTENVSSRHLSQNSRQMGMKYQDKERSFSSPSINLTRQVAQAVQDDRIRIQIEDKLKEVNAQLCFTDKGYRVESGTLKTTPQIWEARVKETLNEIEQFITYSYQHLPSHGQSEFENSQAIGGRDDRLHFENPYSDTSFGNPYSDRYLPSHDKVNRTGVSFGENTSSPNTSGTSRVDHSPKDLDYLKVDTKQDRNYRTVVKEDTIKLKPHQMKYFSVPEACPMFEKKHQGLELKLDKESERLKIRAPESMFMQVKSDVLSFAIKLCERKIPITKAMAIMYSKKETKDFIQEMLGKGNSTLYWEVGDGCIIVCTPEEEFKNCEHKFLLYFKEDKVTLDAKMTSMLKSEAWKTLEKDMQQSKLGCIPTVLMTSNDEKKIIIVDRAECIEEAKQKILAFFQDNKPEKRKLPASKSQLKFLHEFRSGILEEMHVKANEMGMNFVVNKDDLILEGPVNSVSSCFDEMKAVLDKIICKRETFSGPGVAKHLLSSKGKDWLEQIGRGSKCLVTTDSEQNPRSAQSGDNLLATCDLGMGTQLVITQGNITQCAVDVIVNAANPNLQHAYGLAAAIVRAGGQTIQDECEKFVKKHGPLHEGKVMVSGAGHLQCTYIFHAVGPVWRGGHSGEKDTLANTVKEILQMAEKRNITSVAIPALSCGLFKYPVDKATKAIVRSISKHFTMASAGSSLRKVVLIDTKAEPLKGFISAARKLFASSIEVKAEPDETAQYRPHKERFESASSRSLSSRSGDKSSVTPIRIIPGEIAKSKADVIVCTVHPSLDLKKGVLSRSILEQGGNKIQEELQSYAAKYGSVRLGKVVRTSGGNLQCKSIFHMSLPTWKEDKGQTMKLAIQECLDEAEKKHAKSIALPAMGTGKLGYPSDQVASIMFEAIRKWSHSNRDAIIKDVQIIVYSKDRDTLQAFKQLEQQGEAYHRDSKHSGSSRGRGSRGQADHIEEDNSHSEHKMWKDVNVYIYSDERQAIRDTVEAIHRCIKESTKSQIEKNSLIANFNQHKKSAVLSLQSKHDVKINLDETRSSIKITGFDVDVAKAISDFKDILLDASKQRHLAAGMPPVRWQYEVESDKFRDFEPEQVIEIEAAYKNKEPEVRLKDKRGRQYKIVFKDNLEYVLGSKSDKPIKVRRRDILRENTQDIPLPRHWARMGKDEKVKLVDLDPSSSEYKRVEQNFNKQATLKKIQRVQNPTLFQQFKVKKKELEKYNSHVKENEKRLWHGTDSGSVTSIITNGFNRSYCGKNGTALGNGVYFAKDASVSMGYARDGYMFQARVLVGEPAQGAANVKLPPKKPNSDRLYDSLADSPANPSVYVIFHDTQAYPEYLLTF